MQGGLTPAAFGDIPQTDAAIKMESSAEHRIATDSRSKFSTVRSPIRTAFLNLGSSHALQLIAHRVMIRTRIVSTQPFH
jgi:hypothetical protein